MLRPKYLQQNYICIYRVLLHRTYDRCTVHAPRASPNSGVLEFIFSHPLELVMDVSNL